MVVPTYAVAQTQSPPAIGEAQPRADMTGVWMGFAEDEIPADLKPIGYPSPPPFTEEGKKMSAYWAEPSHNLGAQCLPWTGAQGVVSGSYFFPLEIIQKDKQVTIISELLSQVRRVYLDGRGHPEDLERTWLGHSIGKWEGDTLVIDTIGGRAGALNGSGSTVIASEEAPRFPYSPELHLVERIRMVGGGQYLENTLTFTDPVMYTEPITIRRYWRRAPELAMLEYVCNENRRPQDEGTPELKPPPDQ
jgi:hypothetical protein